LAIDKTGVSAVPGARLAPMDLPASRNAFLLATARESIAMTIKAAEAVLEQMGRIGDEVSAAEYFSFGWGLARIESNFARLGYELDLLVEGNPGHRLPVFEISVFDTSPELFVIEYEKHLEELREVVERIYAEIQPRALDEMDTAGEIFSDEELESWAAGSDEDE
jgi:hypothetical protein